MGKQAMLVLTRRVNEVICIGADIRVKVLGIQDGRIRLGVIAPKSVVIDREEIALRKALEREEKGV